MMVSTMTERLALLQERAVERRGKMRFTDAARFRNFSAKVVCEVVHNCGLIDAATFLRIEELREARSRGSSRLSPPEANWDIEGFWRTNPGRTALEESGIEFGANCSQPRNGLA